MQENDRARLKLVVSRLRKRAILDLMTTTKDRELWDMLSAELLRRPSQPWGAYMGWEGSF